MHTPDTLTALAHDVRMRGRDNVFSDGTLSELLLHIASQMQTLQAHAQENQGAATWASFAEKCRKRGAEAAAPALTHRTVCTIAIATSMHRTAVQLDQLHIELAARFGDTSDIDAKIAAANDQMKTWNAAIEWLDRVPGVY